MVTLLSVPLNSFFIGPAKANYREHRFPNEGYHLDLYVEGSYLHVYFFFKIIIILAVPPLMMLFSNYLSTTTG